MSDSSVTPTDFKDHTNTYSHFVRGATGMTLACLFVLVALVGFGKGEGILIHLVATFGMLIGFGTTIYGGVSSNNSWLPAIAVLIVMGLATAALL